VRATAWVPIMVLAMAAPVACQEKNAAAPPPRKAVATDREVVITVANGIISVEPETAVVALGNTLKFTVGPMPAGTSVEVDFVTAPAEGGKDEGKPYVGPFPKKEGDNQNPQRGRYTLSPGQSWTTSPADALGYWKYQVIVRSASGEISLDPGVIIKEGI
jgi:hypothetical protein